MGREDMFKNFILENHFVFDEEKNDQLSKNLEMNLKEEIGKLTGMIKNRQKLGIKKVADDLLKIISDNLDLDKTVADAIKEYNILDYNDIYSNDELTVKNWL